MDQDWRTKWRQGLQKGSSSLLAALVVRSTIEQLRGDLEAVEAEVERLRCQLVSREEVGDPLAALEMTAAALQSAFAQFAASAEPSLVLLDKNLAALTSCDRSQS